YADVANLPVQVTDSDQVPARGSALFGALAAGSHQGGFDSMAEASERLAAPIRHRYRPDAERHQAYLAVYGVYRDLYARMGQDVDQICHRLTAIRRAERPTDVTAI
ncbi:MAG: ribulokinase, partial [Thermaerobacter sp.]|nr:ribulokinase [Thermaerobacter sp.]